MSIKSVTQPEQTDLAVNFVAAKENVAQERTNEKVSTVWERASHTWMTLKEGCSYVYSIVANCLSAALEKIKGIFTKNVEQPLDLDDETVACEKSMKNEMDAYAQKGVADEQALADEVDQLDDAQVDVQLNRLQAKEFIEIENDEDIHLIPEEEAEYATIPEEEAEYATISLEDPATNPAIAEMLNGQKDKERYISYLSKVALHEAAKVDLMNQLLSRKNRV